MSVMDAAYNVGADYKDGGAAGLARRIGRNETTLLHELRRTGQAKLGLLDAVKITVLSGDLRILQAFAVECGQMLVPLPEVMALSADECIQRLGAAAADFGVLAGDTCAALADGGVSANEMARYRREVGVLLADLHRLDMAMTACHAAGQPAQPGAQGDAP